MFILDTNVLAALLAVRPPAEVAQWVRGRPYHAMYTTAVCQAEILAGLALMPAGRRRRELAVAIAAMFEVEFAGRLLPFDAGAAVAYGEVIGLRHRARRPISAVADLLIAAIARAHGATVVTRNTADFEACGVPLVNPWLG